MVETGPDRHDVRPLPHREAANGVPALEAERVLHSVSRGARRRVASDELLRAVRGRAGPRGVSPVVDALVSAFAALLAVAAWAVVLVLVVA